MVEIKYRVDEKEKIDMKKESKKKKKLRKKKGKENVVDEKESFFISISIICGIDSTPREIAGNLPDWCYGEDPEEGFF